MRTVEESAAAPTRTPGGGTGGVPPYVWTACPNAGCAAYGVRRQVWLKQVAVGVVAVPATLLCAACGFALPYSVHRPFSEIEEELMPKIHNGRGPTDKADIAAAAPAQAPVAEAEPPKVKVTVDLRGPDGEIADMIRKVVGRHDPELTTDATADSAPVEPAPAVDTADTAAPEAAEKPKTAPRKTTGRKAGGRN